MTKQGGIFRAYYQLAKPGIVYGNVLVAAAAFAFASHGFNWQLFLATMAGLACIIASACAINNVYDRGIDARMERTRNRALVSGQISPRSAVVFAALLFFIGLGLLHLLTSPAGILAALAGFFSYTLLYTPLKHKSAYALYVGAFAGATPPVVGYAAVTGTLDYQALLLFAFLFVWQLPHFLAIAVYRGEEYAAAGVPLFMKGPYTDAQKKSARRVFYLSLVALLAWCAILIVYP